MTTQYDRKTTTLSPEGRLYQVEYAIEAINQAAAVVALSSRQGLVLVLERRRKTELESASAGSAAKAKLRVLNDRTLCAFAGIEADAATLLKKAAKAGEQHAETFCSLPPAEFLAKQTALVKQRFTQRGGQRPFGVSMVFAGYNAEKKCFELFCSDPSGNYAEWKAVAIGNQSVKANSQLEREYEEECGLKEAIVLGVKIMCSVLEVDEAKGSKLDLCTATLKESGRSGDEVDAVDAVVWGEKEKEALFERVNKLIGKKD